jgi:hypothetical protein
VIDPKVRPFAGARHVGEELELPDCAGPLALDAAARQPRLGARALDQFGADFHDVRRDGFQEARPLLEAGFAVGLNAVQANAQARSTSAAPANAKAGSNNSPVAGLTARNDLSPPDTRCAPIRIGEPWHPLQPARRSTSPVPSRYPYLRVSGMISEAASPMATIPATYQANHCS